MKTVIFSSDNSQICILEICSDTSHLLSLLENETDVYQTEMVTISSPKRLREFIAVRLALKALTNKYLHIRHDTEGKPSLDDESMQLSVSHSRDFITVMVHPSRRVGIDIEIPTEKITKVHTRFLSEVEQQDFYSSTELGYLQLVWSAKEALYKIIGKEAVDFANQLRIFPFELAEKGVMQAEHIPSATKFTLHYQRTPQYNLVYCID